MPLFRYFLFTGATLLGLLFLVDWYVPAVPVTEAHSEIDRSVIRIHSRHKWPEAIRMDTSAPLITAAAPIAVVAEAFATHTPPDKLAQPGKLAQADEPQATSHKSSERASRQARPSRQARRDSRRRPALREAGQRVASYRTPDWFGWPAASW